MNPFDFDACRSKGGGVGEGEVLISCFPRGYVRMSFLETFKFSPFSRVVHLPRPDQILEYIQLVLRFDINNSILKYEII